MSLLLDALHRGDDGGRGKDYAYLYSAEESAESDAPPAESAPKSSLGARPTGFKRPVRKVPRWIFLACGGLLMLALSAGAAWFWFGNTATNSNLAVYAPSANSVSTRPVATTSPLATNVTPVEAAIPVPVPAPTAANATAAPVMAAVAPQPVQSIATANSTERTSNTPKLSVTVLPTTPVSGKTDDGRHLVDAGESKAGKTPPATKSRQSLSPKETAVRKFETSRPAVSAQSLPPMPDAVTKSELAFDLANAWALLDRGQWAEAEADYRVIIGRSKVAEPDAVLGLAVALHRQKRWGEALAAYESSLRVWPGNPVASSAILDILANTNATNAEGRLKQWITDRPQDAAAFSTYGLLMGRKASWPEAVGMLRRARELEPANGIYAYNLAVALDQSQRYAEAAQQYQAALGLGGLGSVTGVIKTRLADLAQMVRP